MSHLKGLFKKITGDSVSYDTLNKQPILDAETKLNIFKDTTVVSISGLESYLKFITKSFDTNLAEKFLECRDMFKKYETKGELLNPNITHIMGAVFGKLHEMQNGLATDIQELAVNIELNVLKPLMDYQRDVALVKDNRKELKEAYDKIEVSRSGLERAKRDVESAQRSGGQPSRLTMMSSSNDAARRVADLARLEEKVQRLEKDLDEANLNANEKYDKYSEGLYKRIAEECDLTTFYLEYLKLQRKYHKQALKRLDTLIPGIKESLATYQKKPIFGCSLNEYVALTNANAPANSNGKTELSNVSPVIRRLIEGMCRQNVFSEEGIFRVAGSRIKMNCLLYAINAGYLDHLDLANDFDVHCLAGVLKQYIRELPDSLLCDEFYDYWIAAINTPHNKVEAFRDVLHRLPKANSENLRYLIKFLAKIVENSDKTKMTTTNMGICFGVSLLSSSNSLNSSISVNNLNTISNGSPTSTLEHSINNNNNNNNTNHHLKSIDMNTATNVFDFLLTNHAELFPGEINFLTGVQSYAASNDKFNLSSSNSFTVKQMLAQSGSLSKANEMLAQHQLGGGVGSGGGYQSRHHTPSNNTNEQHQNNLSNRYSVMISDTSLSEMNNSSHSKLNSSLFSPSSTSLINTVPSNSVNVAIAKAAAAQQTTRHHSKKNSMDSKFNSELSVSRNSNNFNDGDEDSSSSPPSASNSNKLANQMNASSTISLDGSQSSPKMKPKKQAPAPPKVNDSSMSASLIQVSSPSSTSMTETAMTAQVTSSGGGLSIYGNVTHNNSSPTARINTSESHYPLSSQSTSHISNRSNNTSTASNNTPSGAHSGNDLAQNNSLLSRITNANLPAATMIISVPYNNTNNLDVMSSSPIIPNRLGSFRTTTTDTTPQANSNTLLPKPNIPPPSVPGRPPPIGFNVSVTPSSDNEHSHQQPASSLPYPLVSPLYPVLSNLDSSTSSVTSNNNQLNQQSSGNNDNLLPSPTNNGGCSSAPITINGGGAIVKPPKPVLPRKPANGNSLVAQHINKFETGGNKLEDLLDQSDESVTPPSPNGHHMLSGKSSQEVTFL